MRIRFSQWADAFRRFRTYLGLSVAGVVAIAAGLVALAGSLFVFGGVAEDVTQHNGLSRSDGMHLRWFVDHRPATLVHLARLLSNSGNLAVLAVVAICASLFFWRRGLRAVVALAPVLALGSAAALAAIAKSVVGRARPPLGLHLVSESDASFPSGHATDSTALFVTLALVLAVYVLRKPLARVVCVAASGLLAGGIGTSRLVLGVHWPSDVLAGWALGAAVALAVTIAAAVIARAVPPNAAAPTRGARSRVVFLLARERRPKPLRAV